MAWILGGARLPTASVFLALCDTRQGVKAEFLGGAGFLLLMSLKTAVHTRNGRRCGGWHCIIEKRKSGLSIVHGLSSPARTV